jgi:hypothetical protein
LVLIELRITFFFVVVVPFGVFFVASRFVPCMAAAIEFESTRITSRRVILQAFFFHFCQTQRHVNNS